MLSGVPRRQRTDEIDRNGEAFQLHPRRGLILHRQLEIAGHQCAEQQQLRVPTALPMQAREENPKGT
jgi:hypothetical protein